MNWYVIRVRENGILVEGPYKEWQTAQEYSSERKKGYSWGAVFPSFSTDKEEVAREYFAERERERGQPGIDIYEGY